MIMNIETDNIYDIFRVHDFDQVHEYKIFNNSVTEEQKEYIRQKNLPYNMSLEQFWKKWQERAGPSALKDIAMSLLSSETELSIKYPFFKLLFSIRGAFTFDRYINLFEECMFSEGHRIYLKIRPPLLAVQSMPLDTTTSHKDLILVLRRAMDIYVPFSREAVIINGGTDYLLENCTTRHVLLLLKHFPTTLEEGLEVFWVQPRGMEYLMFLMKHIMCALAVMFDRERRGKLIDFELKIYDYVEHYSGFPACGYRRYDSPEDSDDAAQVSDSDTDTEEDARELRQMCFRHFKRNKEYIKTMSPRQRRNYQQQLLKRNWKLIIDELQD